ncbi:hypothetical protein PSTG_02303 [Puccinia striiformis f. sp. tritici PST-78]|uniref:Uncharacterized protein n=1 Tax=Puccinia striiformis f. sp. tritici PST-78 TaxID=1165861 RepID=A0A0L0VYV0_9BASI|nr:hypothetical protein PSTG_02303 [Puccinia striiformis f. sp. tritici PST-78]
MSQAGQFSAGPDAIEQENLSYTIEDHGLLLHKKQIQIPCQYEGTYAKPDYDEEALCEEIQNPKKKLKEVQHKATKLSQNKAVISEQLDMVNRKLESMRLCVAKMERGEQRKVQSLPAIKSIPLHKEIDFHDSVKSHKAAIPQLNETVGVSSSSRDSHMEDVVIDGKVLLSEKLADQDNKDKSEKDGTAKTDNHMDSEEGRNLNTSSRDGLSAEAGVRNFINISEKSRSWACYMHAGGVLMLCITAFHIFRNQETDNVRVNAWPASFCRHTNSAGCGGRRMPMRKGIHGSTPCRSWCAGGAPTGPGL